MNISFNQLAVGDNARVSNLVNVTPSYRNRLMSLGLTPGTLFVVQHRAPLGDPIAIMVRGFRLSIRSQEAEGLMVVKL
ncbi:MAG: FeoA family protein [Porticoccus sp.]|jgi:ferrous iron transport protein A|uniref:FeoA family protein n=1 Tax=Porticoccus sp. Uisw_050_02 TaxID=3230978 RepID=UPI003095ADF7|tara:strand:+ start:3316 stop:3549 length:234 start_codon:yes stop_codon:yes gene_type:complete